jgi:hypothetical protein
MSRYYRTILATLGEFVYDVDMQAVIDKAIAESFALPSTSVLKAMNKKIVQMKADGIWGKLDTYFNFATNSTSFANFSRICSKRRVLGTINGGLITTVNGFEGNGVDAYFDTNFNPSTFAGNYSLDFASRLSVLYKIFDADPVIDGIMTNANNMMSNNNSNAQRINQTLNSISAADMSGTGLKAIIRDNSDDLRLTNKSVEMNRTASSTLIRSENQWLFRRGATYGDSGQSVYAMGESLTYTETQNFRTAYNTFLTEIGLTPIA